MNARSAVTVLFRTEDDAATFLGRQPNRRRSDRSGPKPQALEASRMKDHKLVVE